MKTIKHVSKIALISFLPPLLIYLPFLLKINKLLFLELNQDGMLNIYRNWDGPSYLIVAKSLYNPEIITKLLFSPLPASYFSAHFPLYPLFIKLLNLIFPIHQAGLLVNLLAGFLLNLIFFEFIKEKSKNPYFLTFVFTILPARGFVTKVILAPENLLLLFTLLSIMHFLEKKYLKSSIFLSLAVLTKFQIIILLLAYFFSLLIDYKSEKKFNKLMQKIAYLLLPALSVAILFYFYKQIFGNFLIYFEAQSINKLNISLPFSQFNLKSPWVKTAWLEDLVFYYFLMFLLFTKLFSQKNKNWVFIFFSLLYSAFLSLIPQRDITRFSLPLSPIFFHTFSEFFEKKYVQLAILLLLPVIYFYALNFILLNQAPVNDWSHFLAN